MNSPFLHYDATPLRSSKFFCFQTRPKASFPTVLRRSNASLPILASKFPARDRVIDFGRYKGKMLGTLPSTYLKWISKNLRARDFEEWAKLCDEVLIDPVYQDRIEWEFADKILTGNTLSNSPLPATARGNHNQNAVSELLEISERFGWDNEDKAAWGKIDFALLGSSKGGRIPRIGDGIRNLETKMQKSKKSDEIPDGGDDERRRRRKRRGRREAKNSSIPPMPTVAERTRKLGTWDDEKESKFETNPQQHRERKISSPFPGREALLKKIMERR